MSNEVSNSDIYNLLMNMRGDMGRVEGAVKGFGERLKEHIDDDKALGEAVQKLQISQARQRGFVAALSTIGAVVGAGLGAAADVFLRK